MNDRDTREEQDAKTAEQASELEANNRHVIAMHQLIDHVNATQEFIPGKNGGGQWQPRTQQRPRPRSVDRLIGA